jgi:hypothetical protein
MYAVLVDGREREGFTNLTQSQAWAILTLMQELSPDHHFEVEEHYDPEYS